MKSLNITLCLLILCFLVTISETGAQDFPFHGNLMSGDYAAGFKVVNEMDFSRSYYPVEKALSNPVKNKTGRPLRIYIWYPAGKNEKTRPVLFEDYVRNMAVDYRMIKNENDLLKLENIRNIHLFKGISEDRHAKLLKSETSAYKNTKTAPGSFPVLIFSQGLYYESPVTHFVLCEYLASHGYIVISCPLVGKYSPAVKLDIIDLEAQIRDMEYLISYANNLKSTNMSRTGLIGFDLGGMSNAVFQMRNKNIDAVVSLDSGIMFEHNLRLLRQSPYYDPVKLNIPLIHFTRTKEENTRFRLVEDLSIFEKSKFADTYLIRMKNMQHAGFTSFSMISLENPVPMYWGPPGNDMKNNYEIICLYSLKFLNAYLKNDRKQLSFFSNLSEKHTESGIEILSEKKKSKTYIPSGNDFLNVLYENGIDEAAALFRKIKSENPEVKMFTEAVLNRIGYESIYRNGQYEKAVKILKLNVEAFPESANAYDSLAEAYYLNNNREMAIKNYKKSLELNPENQNAADMLKRLENN